MSRRVDAEILQRTWDDNQDLWGQWSTEHIDVVQRFELLRNELQNAAATPLQHLEEPVIKSAEREKEYQEWQQILEPYVSNQDTWLTAPWMVTEFLIYRKLMQAIGYWDPKSPGYQHDPFLAQKQAGLHSSVTSAESVLAKLFYQTPEVLHEESLEAGLALATSIALWGNKMDLSLWPADKEQRNSDIFSKILEQASQNLLHDDTQVLRRHCQMLKERGGGQVDIIVDNAGFELVTDRSLFDRIGHCNDGYVSTQIASDLCVRCLGKGFAGNCGVLRTAGSRRISGVSRGRSKMASIFTKGSMEVPRRQLLGATVCHVGYDRTVAIGSGPAL
jgi:hypothetical protein